MYFNIKNKIFIHKMFLLLPFLFINKSSATGYIFTLLFAFLHECAHLAAALVRKENIKRIFIMPYGFELRINMPKMENEIFISAAGPVFSLMLSLFFLIIAQKNFFCTNFFLFLLNIFPAVPLDGGRILKFILWKKYGAIAGNVYLRRISQFFSLILMAVGVMFLNVWLFAVSVVIFSKSRSLSASPFYKKRAYPTPVKYFFVAPGTPLTGLLRRFSPYYSASFYSDMCDKVISEDDIVTSLLGGNYITFGDLLTAKSAR